MTTEIKCKKSVVVRLVKFFKFSRTSLSYLKMMLTIILCCSILHLNWKQVQALTKVGNNIQFVKRLRQKLSFFFLAEKDLSAEEVRETEVLFWWNSMKKYSHLARFARACTIFCLFWKAIETGNWNEQ